MITAICILSGVCVFEGYLIAVLVAALREEKKYTGELPLIDEVAFETNWREIHDSHDN